MRIEGTCHCGNIRYVLDWPAGPTDINARACDCGSRCGVVPFVTSAIDDRLYAVVNVNTFMGIDQSALVRAAASFDGEGTGDRLERRKRNWIQTVRITVA